MIGSHHYDSEVVINPTIDHLVFITRLFSMSKIGTLLRGLYTVPYIYDAKGWLYDLGPIVLHIVDVMLNVTIKAT